MNVRFVHEAACLEPVGRRTARVMCASPAVRARSATAMRRLVFQDLLSVPPITSRDRCSRSVRASTYCVRDAARRDAWAVTTRRRPSSKASSIRIHFSRYRELEMAASAFLDLETRGAWPVSMSRASRRRPSPRGPSNRDRRVARRAPCPIGSRERDLIGSRERGRGRRVPDGETPSLSKVLLPVTALCAASARDGHRKSKTFGGASSCTSRRRRRFAVSMCPRTLTSL